MPRAAALGRTEATVPRDGLAAEARRKAGEHRLGQRDFGEQDERLLARFDRGGDRLHIDFGLARSGNAVEQQGLERRGGHRLAKLVRRRRLLVRQLGRREGGVGRGIGGVRSEEHTSELQSLMRNSYAVFCLKKNNTKQEKK